MKLRTLAVGLLASIIFLGCGKNSESEKGKEPSNRVQWSTIPSEYHPEIRDIEFPIAGVERVDINLFGFNRDVEVVYSPDVPHHTGVLRTYTVWYESASFGSLTTNKSGTEVEISAYGEYRCSIRTENGRITNLKGGCYVRLQIYLPVGAKVEVYNVGNLLTKRFNPMSTEKFLKEVDRAPFPKEKFKIIDDYLNSYTDTGKQPSLTSRQLGMVISEFLSRGDKFEVLRKLHVYVSDRQNLGAMIDEEFTYFDREEARRIVGL